MVVLVLMPSAIIVVSVWADSLGNIANKILMNVNHRLVKTEPLVVNMSILIPAHVLWASAVSTVKLTTKTVQIQVVCMMVDASMVSITIPVSANQGNFF